jgi:hypothetical protein
MTQCRVRHLERQQLKQRILGAGFVLVLCASWLSGCASIGPKAVPRDRIDYAGAIGDSWKQQTLLNIVKLRYSDFPVFLDINQVIAGYEFNSSATAGFNASSSSYDNPAPSFLTLGGSILLQGGYKDQPTVLYTPSTGSDFITRLMTPIAPSAVLFLLQAGYAADGVMNLTIDSINGINNESRRRVGAARPADPRFVRLGKLINEMQVAGALEVRILRPKDEAETSMIIFRPGTTSPELEAKRREIADILGLDPAPEEIKVYYGGYSGRRDEIAMLTRSMLQIMLELGFFADVPAGDIAEGRATPSGDMGAPDGDGSNILRIASADAPPKEAFVAVPYHGHWFWIADTDIRSKTIFGAVMLLFSISDVGAKSGAPVVTVPTTR